VNTSSSADFSSGSRGITSVLDTPSTKLRSAALSGAHPDTMAHRHPSIWPTTSPGRRRSRPPPLGTAGLGVDKPIGRDPGCVRQLRNFLPFNGVVLLCGQPGPLDRPAWLERSVALPLRDVAAPVLSSTSKKVGGMVVLRDRRAQALPHHPYRRAQAG
jgi:hypothetical protein